VNRVESISTRPPSREVKRGSSTGPVRAWNTASASIPVSFGATRTRSRRIGSSTSTESGPTRVSPRSRGARPEAWSETWTPPRTTLKEASITLRFG
jgi:hypothetical protein